MKTVKRIASAKDKAAYFSGAKLKGPIWEYLPEDVSSWDPDWAEEHDIASLYNAAFLYLPTESNSPIDTCVRDWTVLAGLADPAWLVAALAMRHRSGFLDYYYGFGTHFETRQPVHDFERGFPGKAKR